MTKRKQTEEALKEERNFVSAILETIGTLVVVLDREGRIVRFNRACEKATGYSFDEVKGRPLRDIFLLPEETDSVEEVFKALKGGRFPITHQNYWVTKDGRLRLITWSNTAMVDDQGIVRHIIGSGLDITEKQQAEDKILKLSHAVEQSPSMILIYDQNGVIEYLNPKYTEITGYTLEDLGGLTAGASGGQSPKEYTRMWAELGSSGKWRGEVRNRKKQGGFYWESTSVSAIRNSLGEVTHYVKVAEDITEKKRIEQELTGYRQRLEDQVESRTAEISRINEQLRQEILERRTAEEEQLKFMALVRYSGDFICMAALDGQLLYLNEAGRRLVGLDGREDITHLHITDFAPDDQVNHISEEVIPTVEQRGRWRGETRLKKFIAGRNIEVAADVFVVKDFQNGQPVCLATIMRDITEKKKTEERIKRSEERFRRAIIDAPIPIMLHAEDGEVLCISTSWTELTGYSPDEIPTMSDWVNKAYGENRDEIKNGINKLFDLEGKVSEGEFVITAKNGRELTWDFSSAHLGCLPDGRRLVISMAMDVTQRKEAEQALAGRTEELVRSNAELEQFAYIASHDLQEPLRKIINFVDLLEKRYKGHIDERADKYINYVVDGATRMQKLINDLLTYSRVGRAEYTFQPVNVQEILEGTLSDLHMAVKESGAVISFGPLPTIKVNQNRFGQLLQNLIGNAIKFRSGEPPRIHVSAEFEDGQWGFSVSDNGIGLEPRHAKRIFEVFQRLHARDEYPGTGIGLAICKKIVDRHGGRIWVESQPGNGATFCFTIPVRR
ncbi:MAG: PAS domain S-box protein [Deltaproteobacteria bacterium]|nr:PAS domain S-box protein [Deltaproteobacteria bacterium]